MRGSDAARHIRSHEAAHGVLRAAIVLCTGCHIEDQRWKDRLADAGVDAVWTKPLPSHLDGSLQSKIAAIIA